MLRARFIMLAVLAGIFMVIVPPLGIVFFILVAIYYVTQTMQQSGQPHAMSENAGPAHDGRQDGPKPRPDFYKLFNKREYVDEQDRLR